MNFSNLIIFRINRRGDFLCSSEKVFIKLAHRDICAREDMNNRNLMILQHNDENLIVSSIDLLFKFKI